MPGIQLASLISGMMVNHACVKAKGNFIERFTVIVNLSLIFVTYIGVVVNRLTFYDAFHKIVYKMTIYIPMGKGEKFC